MKSLPAAFLVVLAVVPSLARAQGATPGRAAAVIDMIFADSAGHAIRGGKPVSRASLDTVLTTLHARPAAQVWFSWAGGAAHKRTPAQDSLLARVRKSGVAVELRSDSTFFSRVLP